MVVLLSSLSSAPPSSLATMAAESALAAVFCVLLPQLENVRARAAAKINNKMGITKNVWRIWA